MKRKGVIVLSALVLILWALPAQAIRNGDPESRVPYNGVGKLPSGPTHPLCTGAMVSPFVVLTAAQCVSQTSPDDLEFSLSPTRTARVTAIRIHPEFSGIDGVNLAFDVALLRLDKEVARNWGNVTLSAVRDVTTPTGVVATGIGFGDTGVGSGSRRSGALLVHQYVEGADPFGNPIPDAFVEVLPGNERNQMMCPGDTGGPLFFEDWIAGVASFRFVATCPEDGPGYYVTLKPHMTWIRDTLRELDPPGACRANDDAAFATDGGCKDLVAGRVWSRVAAGTLSQPNAVSYCYGLEEAGQSDWRLPTAQELSDLDAHGGATRIKLPRRAWSSTSGAGDPSLDRALRFDFDIHATSEIGKAQRANVICVRGAAGP